MGTTYFDLPTYDAVTDRLDLPKQLNDITGAVDIALERVFQKIPTEETMNDIERRLTDNANDIRVVEGRLDTHDDEIDMLRDDLDRLIAKIEAVETNITTIKQDITAIEVDVTAIKEWLQNSHDVENLDNFFEGGVII